MGGSQNQGSQQNQHKIKLTKLRRTKLLTQKRKAIPRYPTMMVTGNPGSQQSHRKVNVATLRKTKLGG